MLVGGGERSLVEIAASLRAQPSIDLVVTTPGPGPLSDALQARDVRTESLPYRWAVSSDDGANLRASSSGLHEIRQFLISYRPDVVMTNTSVIPWFAYLAHRLGIPHAWFLREFVGDDLDIPFYPSADDACALIRRFSDRVFVNSEHMKARYSALLGRDDILVVYPTISRDIFDHLRSPDTRSDEGVCKLIVYGTVIRPKNQLEVLQAARILHQRRKDFALTIMGLVASRVYYESLVTFVREHGLESIVRFLDYHEEPYEESPHTTSASYRLRESRLDASSWRPWR
jgi:glycosyltransferase involved in cell wall biosynthesis